MVQTLRKKTQKNTTKRMSKSKDLVVIPTNLSYTFGSFEKEYEKKLKTYKNKSNSIQQELIKLFNKPFTPSKISPRNDFYTYINYSWLQDTSKSADKRPKDEKYFVQIDDFRVVQDKVYRELIDLVKNYVKNNNTPKSKQLGNIYNSLLYLDHNSANKHIKHAVEKYEFYKKEDNLWKFMAHINTNEIVCWGCPIHWKVQADDRNSKKFSNFISLPELSLYDALLYFKDPDPTMTKEQTSYRRLVQKKYVEYIDEIFDSCLGKGHGLSGKDVFEIEYDLLIAMGCESVKNDSPDFYNVVKSEDALEKYGFNWKEFTYYLGYKTTPSFFICDSLNYLKCVSKLLVDNWKTPKWKSYWLYLYFRQIIRFDKRRILIHYNFNGKFIHGIPDHFPFEIYPVFGLSITFNTLLTDEYVNAFANYNDIKYVDSMGRDLIEVYKRIIRRNTWLSPKTKKYALLKLEKLDFKVGIPPKKMREDPLLDYDPNDAWGNLIKITKWRTEKYVSLQGGDVIDIPMVSWNAFKLIGQQAYIVNAMYTPTQNSIYIPLAYIQKPFIDMGERGIEYNLAHLGFTLGHEMSHSLDDMGSKYDYQGNLHDWWTEADKKKFKDLQKDIIKQYEAFSKYDGIDFDAAPSIGEDLADISGFTICQEYLRDFQDKNEDLVPIRSLSFQAFYVYFAMQQRQHIYKQAIAAQLKQNPHPMDKYRANCPLSRSELFRSLYNIQKGDKMYWPSTNTVW